jgi:glycerol-1-phosphate dehydrogenase [NAD(P)+]
MLLAADEPALLDCVEALMAGDPAAMERLVRILVLSGLGTAIVGNSQPASQGEHLISHYIDMFIEAGRPLVFHGEQVGVTTLTMARLQEKMLDGQPPVLQADTSSEGDFIARYGEEIGRSCWKEFAQKRLTRESADALTRRLHDNWNRICNTIRATSLRSDFLQRVLLRAGAPTTPEEIHIPREFYDKAVARCREIRNRYTFLDLAESSGVFRTASSRESATPGVRPRI